MLVEILIEQSESDHAAHRSASHALPISPANSNMLHLFIIYIVEQRKLVTYQTGYAGKSPLNLSYDNSFFKERSSAVGRGDGPV